MTRFIDLTGARFGRLTVISADRRRVGARMRTFWSCRCDCGNMTSVVRDTLINGMTTSCGCFQRECVSSRSKTHGRSKTRLHRIWGNMIGRCHRPQNISFHNYGGRGITVCAEWRTSFEAFARDVGDPPSVEHSLDRIDNDAGYYPGNVRWATRQQQGRNRRGLQIIKAFGREMCIAEAAELAGLKYQTVRARILKHGWTVADALAVAPSVGQKGRHAHLGIRKAKRPMPGSRNSRWKRRMDGTVERRQP